MKFPFPDLKTKRTTLRILQPDDADALFKHFSDISVTKMMDIEPCKSRVEALNIIRFHLDGTGCRWGIFSSEESVLLGTCGYHKWKTSPKSSTSAEVGYDLSKAYWGNGYMQEVLPVVFTFGFQQMKLDIIEAECDPANEKSIALLEKFGFRLAETLENHQKRYHLSKAEWDTHSTR